MLEKIMARLCDPVLIPDVTQHVWKDKLNGMVVECDFRVIITADHKNKVTHVYPYVLLSNNVAINESLVKELEKALRDLKELVKEQKKQLQLSGQI